MLARFVVFDSVGAWRSVQRRPRLTCYFYSDAELVVHHRARRLLQVVRLVAGDFSGCAKSVFVQRPGRPTLCSHTCSHGSQVLRFFYVRRMAEPARTCKSAMAITTLLYHRSLSRNNGSVSKPEVLVKRYVLGQHGLLLQPTHSLTHDWQCKLNIESDTTARVTQMRTTQAKFMFVLFSVFRHGRLQHV